MSLSNTEVKKISHLARIAIDDAAIDNIAQNLNNILQIAEKIASIDVKNIEPMAHPQNQPQRLRSDVISEDIQRDLLQSIAGKNHTESGFYLVPKVIEIEE
jgi:aspartyl-tRNA(Asn)/glutamyl-tRNA(Gln) amidotransferase subunit C